MSSDCDYSFSVRLNEISLRYEYDIKSIFIVSLLSLNLYTFLVLLIKVFKEKHTSFTLSRKLLRKSNCLIINMKSAMFMIRILNYNQASFKAEFKELLKDLAQIDSNRYLSA